MKHLITSAELSEIYWMHLQSLFDSTAAKGVATGPKTNLWLGKSNATPSAFMYGGPGWRVQLCCWSHVVIFRTDNAAGQARSAALVEGVQTGRQLGRMP